MMLWHEGCHGASQPAGLLYPYPSADPYPYHYPYLYLYHSAYPYPYYYPYPYLHQYPYPTMGLPLPLSLPHWRPDATPIPTSLEACRYPGVPSLNPEHSEHSCGNKTITMPKEEGDRE